MATAAELLASKTSTDKTLVIDNDLRTIIIPSCVTNLGVENDDDVLRLNFKMPRYLGDTDLSKFDIRINYLNANGKGDVYTVSDMKIVGDHLTFSWLVGPNATKYKGNTTFNVCMKIIDSEGYIQQEYNTTIATLPVLEGLETETGLVSYYSDVLEQWKRELFGIGDTEEAGIHAASEAEQENIAQKGIEVLATIPEDYQTTYKMANDACRTKADAITCSAEGETIFLNDASDDHIRNLKIFGRTEQSVTTGRNLAYVNINVPDYSYLGVICSKTDDGNISLNGVATDNMWNRLASASLVAGETYTLSANTAIGLSLWDVTANASFNVKSVGSDSVTFVAPNTGSYSIVLENATGTIFADVRANIMLNIGSTADTWEPYSNGVASPSVDFPQELRNVENTTVDIYGKNLVNSVLVGEDSTQYSNCLLVKMDKFEPNTTYTLSFIAASGHKMYANENLFSYKYILGTGKRQSITLTTKPIVDSSRESQYTSGHWIVLKNSEGNTVEAAFKNVQIEMGSSATEYSEHVPAQSVSLSHTLRGIPVSTNGNYTDANGQQWIGDYVDYERGVLVQRIAYYEFDGSDDEVWQGIFNYGGKDIDYVNITLLRGSDAYSTPLFCNQLTRRTWNEEFTCFMNEYKHFVVGGAYFDGNMDDIASFKTYLNANPMTLTYVLETPIETPLTEVEIQAFKELYTNFPNTTVLNDAEAHMSLTYNADTKTYLDTQIQAAVDAWLTAHFATTE